MLKRGKQHIHAGEVFAKGQEEAFCVASHHFGDKQVFNIWIIQSDNLFKFEGPDSEIWMTLPDKKFRDAIAYKAGEKLKNFIEKNRS